MLDPFAESSGTFYNIMGRPVKYDLAGRRFGKLVVIKFLPHTNGGWLCKCDCGRETITTGTKLITGNTKSCGCYKQEMVNFLGDKTRKHGFSSEPEYGVWLQMHRRCSKGDRNSKNYYDRGIRVCERWTGDNGYINFVSDMGRRPFEGASIDRIDNNKGYSPDNCRWATSYEQSRNCRRNIFITINGENRTLSDWADYYGINRETVRCRYKKGYPLEYVFSNENFSKTRKYYVTKN